MNIEIKGWKSEGLRCPDVDFNLDKNKRLITLIQMPNGTGKTTTLKLLKQCFYETNYNDNITKFRNKLGVVLKKGLEATSFAD